MVDVKPGIHIDEARQALRRAMQKKGLAPVGLGNGVVVDAEVVTVNGVDVPQIAAQPEDRLREEIEVLKREAANLTAELATLENKQNSAQKQLSEKIEELGKMQALLESTKNEKKELAEIMASGEKDKKEQTERINKLNSQIENLQIDFGTKLVEMQILNSLLKDSNTQTASLLGKLKNLEEEVKTHQDEINHKRQKINFGKELFKKMHAEVKKLNQDLQTRGLEINTLTEELETAETINKNLLSDIHIIEQQWFGDLRRNTFLKKEVTTKNLELSKANEKNLNLGSELKDLNQKYNENLNAIADLQKKLFEKQTEVAENLEKITKLEFELNDLQTKRKNEGEVSGQEKFSLMREVVKLNNLSRTQLVTIERLSDSTIAMRATNQVMQEKLDKLKLAAVELLRIKDDFASVGKVRGILDQRGKSILGGGGMFAKRETNNSREIINPKEILNSRIPEILKNLPNVKPKVPESKIPKMQAEEEKDLETLKFRKKIKQAEVFADIFSVLDEIYPYGNLLARKKYMEIMSKIKEIRLVAEQESNSETRNKKIFTFQVPNDKYGITEKVKDLLKKK